MSSFSRRVWSNSNRGRSVPYMVFLTLCLIGGAVWITAGTAGVSGARRAPPAPAGWQRTSFPQTPYPLDVGCWSSADCIAVGDGSAMGTTDGGVLWTSQVLPPAVDLDGVSCPTESECFAVGSMATPESTSTTGTILMSANGGTTWTTETLPTQPLGDPFFNFTAIACPSSSQCVAVGMDLDGSGIALMTTNSGSTWQSGTLPTSGGNPPDAIAAVSCPSVTICIAVTADGAGVIYATSNGGSTWVNQIAPVGADPLRGVSCASTTVCSAVGESSIVATTNGGTTWVQQTAPAGTLGLADVSCPSVSDCFGSGWNGSAPDVIVTTNGGTSWAAGPLTGSGGLTPSTAPQLRRAWLRATERSSKL